MADGLHEVACIGVPSEVETSRRDVFVHGGDR